MFMDEVVSKWGFGSGISLFIVAGVAQQLFVRALNFLPSPTNPDIAAGAIPALIQSLISGDATTATLQMAAVLATVLIFGISVYAQSMKVEIPLSFGRIRGQGIRWPLNFFYTSNIPVILVVLYWRTSSCSQGYLKIGVIRCLELSPETLRIRDSVLVKPAGFSRQFHPWNLRFAADRASFILHHRLGRRCCRVRAFSGCRLRIWMPRAKLSRY